MALHPSIEEGIGKSFAASQRAHRSKKLAALVCDLDGTLCDINHRLHLIDSGQENPVKDWDAFFERMDQDVLMDWCAEILERFSPMYQIIFCTGRSTDYEGRTREWIEKHLPKLNGNYTLLMRREGDRREDTVVKRDLYLQHVKETYDVLFVLDDRLRLAKMWRELGLTCLHCANGEY